MFMGQKKLMPLMRSFRMGWNERKGESTEREKKKVMAGRQGKSEEK